MSGITLEYNYLSAIIISVIIFCYASVLFCVNILSFSVFVHHHFILDVGLQYILPDEIIFH